MSNASDFIIENGVLTKYSGREKEVTIPEGVTAIGTGAFRIKNVVRVIMPDSVEEIGWDAFSNCKMLEEVVFSRNLKRILSNAFAGCTKLHRVALPEGLESIGGCAFNGCSRLEELVLPEHDPEIGQYAFSGCSSLVDENGYSVVRGVLYGYNEQRPEEFHVPEGVKQTQFNPGWYPIHVRSVYLPASLEHLDDGLLKDVGRLEHCEIHCTVTDPKEAQRIVKRVFDWEVLAWAYLEGKVTACDLVLEALKKQIASKAAREELLDSLVEDETPDAMIRFLGCMKKLPLEELDAAIEKAKHAPVRAALLDYKQKTYTTKKVSKAKKDAQDKELGLKEKTLSDWRKTLKIAKRGERYAVTGVKESYVEDAVIWKKTAPDGVELVIPAQIGGIPVVVDVQAFRDCAYIKTIVIEEGVTSIGDSAFYNCRRLRDVYVPGSVTDFGETDGALFCAGVYGKPCTIHAPAGSKAEELAKVENLPFVAE